MDAVVVVEAQVGVELALEAGVAGIEVAGKRRSPALIEDRLVQRLNVAVGLRTTGADPGEIDLQPLNRGREVALELVAVVGEQPLQAPAGGAQISGDATGQPRGLLGGRVAALGDDKLRPNERGADVDRGELPDRSLGALQPADVEAVDPDQLAGVIDLDGGTTCPWSASGVC